MDMTVISQIGLAIFSGFMSLFVGWYGRRLKRQESTRQKESKAIKEKTDAVSLGLQSLLRNNIIRLHDRCMNDGRQKSYYDAQNMEFMYIAYHGLGGNGMITEIYDDFKTFKIVSPDGQP